MTREQLSAIAARLLLEPLPGVLTEHAAEFPIGEVCRIETPIVDEVWRVEITRVGPYTIGAVPA